MENKTLEEALKALEEVKEKAYTAYSATIKAMMATPEYEAYVEACNAVKKTPEYKAYEEADKVIEIFTNIEEFLEE